MSFASEALSDSPVLAARMGDTSGTVATDSSGNGHNGTYHNVTLNQTGLDGSSDKAVAFNGVDSYVDFGNPSALQITGPMTIHVIPKLGADMPANQAWGLVTKGFDGTTEGYMLQLFSYVGVQVSFSQYSAAGTVAVTLDNLGWAVGERHLITAKYDGANWKIYINGRLRGSFAGVGPLANSSPLIVGADSHEGSITRPFNGVIDEVYIYNTALSDARIQATALAAGLLDAGTTFTAAVNSNGTKIDLSFSTSVTGVDANDFFVTVAGKPVALSGQSGSGANWSLKLADSWIASSQGVKVSYIGTAISGADNAVVTATNSSAIPLKVVRNIAHEMGGFIHISGETFGMASPPTQADANSKFNPTSLNVGQWLDTIVSAGCRRAVLTAKHDMFCIWPTSSGCPNIGAVPGYTSVDIVQLFVTGCRARGLDVGIYLNFYDGWWLGSRPGADNTYGGGFQAYITTQITELLSNYGQIDEFWIDSWTYHAGDVSQPGYTLADYATIRALISSLQPNCVLVNNNHEYDLSHSDVAPFEGDTISSPPDTTNLLPAEFSETIRADHSWVWAASGESNLKDPYALAATYKGLRNSRCSYLLNFPPNNLGVMPASTVTFAALLGSIIGRQGGVVLPLVSEVKSGVDRGDGIVGTRGSGINGSSILGML